MFDLKITKEIFPYNYYTEHLYNNGIGSVKDSYKLLQDKSITINEYKESL